MPKCNSFLLFFCLFLLYSCGNDNPLAIDTSSVKIKEVKFKRLDQDLFHLNKSSIQEGNEQLMKKYGTFYETYFYQILNRAEEKDSALASLKAFISDKDMYSCYQTVQKIYTQETIQSIEKEYTEAFKRFKYHFPDKQIPANYITFISGFNYNITTADSTLGIGLDMYMGSANPYYQMLAWPLYHTRQLNKNYVVVDGMRGWIVHEFDVNQPINNLLNHMVFFGKLHYCLDAVLPDTQDSIKIAYTTQQMNYCKKYEKDIWNFFTDKERLYKNDLKEIAEYTSEGPFTAAISKDCPPRIAFWIGWQIVRQYMKKHPEISLTDLMKENDAQKILTQSKYKP